MRKYILLFAFAVSGCATITAPSPELATLPKLDKGWARVFIADGQFVGPVFNVDLKDQNNTGPVYIDNEKVGSTAQNEYFAVDLLPGSYDIHWLPFHRKQFYSKRKVIVVSAGEIRYFSCDMKTYGIGSAFGLIGGLLSKYTTEGLIDERQSIDKKRRLTSYLKLANQPVLRSDHESKAYNKSVPGSTTTPKLASTDSVPKKLVELKKLRDAGAITNDDFEKEKQKLLNEF